MNLWLTVACLVIQKCEGRRGVPPFVSTRIRHAVIPSPCLTSHRIDTPAQLLSASAPRSPHESALWELLVMGFLCPKSNALLVWRQLNKCSLLDPSRKNTTRLRMFTIVHTCPIRRKTGLRQKGCSSRWRGDGSLGLLMR